jgi:uncharacterized protein YccT (UPF0319 family)
MKKLLFLLLTFALLLLSFTSCAKLVSTETQEVEATVVDTYHRGAFTQMMNTGNVTVPITYPAKHEVYFKYEDVTLTINDEVFYYSYKDKIGSKVKCNLIIKHYDDGSNSRTLEIKEIK